MENLIRNRIKESIGVKQKVMENCVEIIKEVADEVISAYKKGNKVILLGNGGSAADAQHIASELVGKFCLDRKSLQAIALTVNTSILTAVGNDYSFDKIFVRQLESIGKKGDVVIGITTSGNSKNVIEALKLAKNQGLITVAFTGMKGGKVKIIAKYCLCVPSNNTPRIQEVHIMIAHIICEIVERKLFGAR